MDDNLDKAGGSWTVYKDYFGTRDGQVPGSLHQMVGNTAKWKWSIDAAVYLERGILSAARDITSRYEIVTVGTLTRLKLKDFKVHTPTGTAGIDDKELTPYKGSQTEALERINGKANPTLMQLAADTEHPNRYYWAYWHTGGTNGPKLFAMDVRADTSYIEYSEGGIVYLPATPDSFAVYPKLFQE
ncbi:hypothetical protein B0H16DRAFT_1473923 [Mycena metata]|uniref:Uncharacterized protein n=1 Tax=Mycena metata TaxID=1033252 RepID=A0AAD7HJR8_9AGAR|nr:hypothetical protein B0H16DRAFT_1473923 [Mycena metata]